MKPTKMLIAGSFVAALGAGAAGCNAVEVNAQAAPDTSAEQTIAQRLDYSAAEPADEATLARLPGEVVMAEHNSYRFGPSVRARLVEWHVAPGERVATGDALATLVSPELGDLEATAAELARVAREREKYVEQRREDLEAGVVAMRAVQEAELAAAEARAQLNSVRRQLRVRKNKQLRSESGNGWSWVAPMDGRVGDISCKPGGLYGAESPCIELLDMSRAELRVEVPERLLARTEGTYSLQWEPDSASPGTAPVELTLVRREAALDSSSRTQSHYFRDQDDTSLMVGASGLATLNVPAPEGVVLVPRLAVTELQGEPHVFVKASEGLPQPVAVDKRGQFGDGLLVFSEEIEAGTEVVSRGTFLLKSQLALQ
jgi:cobalt-zinc-cadmium efflux system membrane fusion protein